MVSYAAMVGTFAATFFGYTTLTNENEFNVAILGCILSVCALFAANIVMNEIKERIN